MTHLDEIDSRKHNAEIASIRETGGVLGWPKFYDRDGDREQMANDFIWMRRFIGELLDKNSDLEHLVESLGGKV